VFYLLPSLTFLYCVAVWQVSGWMGGEWSS
jgi:hypothetical protein